MKIFTFLLSLRFCLFIFLMSCTLVSRSQVTELFETETANATVFSEGGRSFTLSSQSNGPFRINRNYPGAGWNGVTTDNVFIDNDAVAQPSTPCQFSIASSDGVPFQFKSAWLYLARSDGALGFQGSLTVTGFLGGNQVFSAVASSGFNQNPIITNGYTLINMLTYGGANNSLTYVDRIQFTTNTVYGYVALDAFTFLPALTPVIIANPLLQTVCSGTAVNFTANIANANSYQWQEFITGWTNLPNSGIYSGVNSTTLTISNSTSLTGRQYRLVATNVNGSVNTSGALLTVTPLLTSLAGVVAGLPVCVTQIGSLTGNIYADISCRPVAAVTASGSQPLTGIMETCVQLDASTSSFNGHPYAQRHYYIAPVLNPTTATGNITLYFSQADFNAFNTARGTYPPLPTGAADATGIANLRLTHFRGTGTAPGNYTGTPLLIDPPDAGIVWNATNNYWEVTTAFTGLGGLYLHTGAVTLPVRLVNFAVSRQGGWNELRWTTAAEENMLRYEVQYGSNGADFITVGDVPVNGNSSIEKSYSYRHNPTAAGTGYYRLRMVDVDGAEYSSVIRVRDDISKAELSLLSNPVKEQIRVMVITPATTQYIFQLTDLNGRVLHRATRAVQAGSSTIDIRPASKPGRGMYLLTVESATDKSTLKVMVE